MNQWLALVWSVWRLAFPPLPLSFLSFIPSLFLSRSLSLTLSLSLPIALLSLPGSPPSARLPAAYKHTAHFCLAARRLACSLEPAAEDWEDLRHACGSLPTCLCVLDHWCLYPAALCVCACVSESRDLVRSNRDECWMFFKYLLNRTRSSARVCTWDKTHLHVQMYTNWFSPIDFAIL